MTQAPPAIAVAPVVAPRLTRRKLLLLAAGGLVVTVIVCLACSLFGPAQTSLQVWLEVRLVRLLAGAIVGAGLAVSGAALQGLLRNPLAEPYILGVSSGAGVGVLAGKVLAGTYVGAAWFNTSALALVGAVLTCLVVYGIAQRRGRLDPYVLLLSGVIVNVFNGALMLALLLYLDPQQIGRFIQWSMGQLPDGWAEAGGWGMPVSALAVAAGWSVLVYRGGAFNALGLGDTVASSSGVPVHWLRVETFLVVGLMTSAAVALAGPIGFIGLIVPHVCRMIVGPDHRVLVIASGFAGAVFLMVADTICRTVGPLIGTGVVPVGVLTALSGGPFFIYLLKRRGAGGKA